MTDNNKGSTPVHIRVPLNTHPSQLNNTPSSRYGAVLDENQSSYYYSAAGDSRNSTPFGSPSSFRGQFESFAGSYSRTSALYMAENLSISHRSTTTNSNPPTNHHGEDDLESLHQQEEHNNKSKLLPIDHTLTQTLSSQNQGGYHLFPSLSRHTTVASVISQQFNTSQQQHDPHYTASPIRSTFIQSIFNSINVLVGIGVLALPLGFRCAGWLYGSLIFFFCVFATNYTAKLIAKCLDFYPNSTTYGDMGAAAFGDRGRTFVSTIFVVELMTIG